MSRCKTNSNVARAAPARDPESRSRAPEAAYSESVRCDEMKTFQLAKSVRTPSSQARMPASPVLITWPPPTRHTTTAQSACRSVAPLRLVSSPSPASRFTTHVPVYDLTIAAGFWGPESSPEEVGWTEMPGVSIKPGMFAARVTGASMEPLIPDGSWCLFRPCPAGSREGRIVLVQFASLGVGENGGRFTVKKYHAEKRVTGEGWRHASIQLLPLNPAFEPIEIEPEDAGDLRIVGEFVRVTA